MNENQLKPDTPITIDTDGRVKTLQTLIDEDGFKPFDGKNLPPLSGLVAVIYQRTSPKQDYYVLHGRGNYHNWDDVLYYRVESIIYG